jgi:hypothetical protein
MSKNPVPNVESGSQEPDICRTHAWKFKQLSLSSSVLECIDMLLIYLLLSYNNNKLSIILNHSVGSEESIFNRRSTDI